MKARALLWCLLAVMAAVLGCQVGSAAMSSESSPPAPMRNPPSLGSSPLPLHPSAAFLPGELAVLGVRTWTWDYPEPPFTFDTYTELEFTRPNSGGVVDVADTSPGDLLAVDAAFMVEGQIVKGELGPELALFVVEAAGTDDEATSPIDGARAMISKELVMVPMTLIGAHTIERGGVARIGVEGRVRTLGEIMHIQSVASIRVIHYRPRPSK